VRLHTLQDDGDCILDLTLGFRRQLPPVGSVRVCADLTTHLSHATMVVLSVQDSGSV
jgi:hypothetical protein